MAGYLFLIFCILFWFCGLGFLVWISRKPMAIHENHYYEPDYDMQSCIDPTPVITGYER